MSSHYLVTLPRKFVEDHTDRLSGDLSFWRVEREGKSQIRVIADQASLDSVLADAEWYAEGNVDDCRPLVESAKRTVKAIKAAYVIGPTL